LSIRGEELTTTLDEEKANSQPQQGANRADIDKAFRLFTRGKQGPITVGGLRKIAKDLKFEVTDDELRDMVSEATGDQSSKTVNRINFENVMRRAGAFR
jgi:Ca2+-binding EF-hand superfamily protein